MKEDENGNPIEEEPIIRTDDEFVDEMIADLLTDDEKKSLSPKEEPIEQAEEDEPETETVASEPQEVKEEELKDKIFVVNGEKLTYEQLKAGNLRQSDYTRKTQEIADEKARLAKFAVLNDYLEKNPHEFQRVVELFKEQPKEQVVPEDPIDAITYHATQNAINAIKGPIDGVNQQMVALAKQQQIAQVQSAVAQDPLSKDTQAAMNEYVWGEYAELHGKEEATRLYQTLDSEPKKYVDLYTKMRKRIESAKKPEKVLSVEKKVPFVADSSQNTHTESKDKIRRRDLKALQNKTRGGKVEDVVRFLEVSGMVDHLS